MLEITQKCVKNAQMLCEKQTLMKGLFPKLLSLQHLRHLNTLTHFSAFFIIYLECYAENIYFVICFWLNCAMLNLMYIALLPENSVFNQSLYGGYLLLISMLLFSLHSLNPYNRPALFNFRFSLQIKNVRHFPFPNISHLPKVWVNAKAREAQSLFG